MAIAFESYANTGGAGSGTTVTNSLTVTSAGSNNVAVVFASSGDSTHDVHATAMTWNGVSMAQVGTTGTGGANGTLTMWILVNPAIGTENLVSTWNSSVTAYGAYHSIAIFSGCKQSAQPDASTNPTNFPSTNPAVTVTTVAANAMVVLLTNAGGTAGANTTLIQAAVGFSGYDLATTAGNYTVNETTGAYTTTAGGLSIAPFVAAVANGNFLDFM